jgi:ABC-type sugar transport system ATPase subunit/ribose/xylose/arabinose/galactoside ABC-type transport system permease subunit
MRGIRKRFGQAEVLRGVDFTCVAGEIHALLGENGAGKSTLLKILNGALEADSGVIEIEGTARRFHDPAAAMAGGIATVYQELTLLPNLTVAENLALGREPVAHAGVLDRRAMRELAGSSLSRLGLTIDPEARVADLEIAERQAIEICKALAARAHILILDEPTAALGEVESHLLFTILRSLREQGLGIIYVSHRLSEVMTLADRVTVLRNGRGVLTRPVAKTTQDELISAMVGREVEALFPPRSNRNGGAPRLLTAQDVRYGRRLRGVSLDLHAGEIVGVTGLLGSGQRELGRVLGRVVRASSGSVQIVRNSRAPRVAYVPPDRKEEGLALDRPVRENVTLNVLNDVLSPFRVISPGRDRAMAETIRVEVGVMAGIEDETSWLSGGNQQKTLIGRSLAERPDILVLEEPTQGVDVGAKADIYRIIRKLADDGTGVLIISSDSLEIGGLSDRVIVLDQGRVAVELPGADATEERILHHMHGAIGASETNAARAGGRLRSRIPSLGDATIPLVALLLIVLVTALGSATFLHGENLQNLARQAIVFGLVGLGQLPVILTGGIDLSIGSIVGLTNLITTDLLMQYPSLFVPAALLALTVGALVGAVNATLVRLGVPAFLATFAMMSVLRGIIVWRYPQSIGPVPEAFWTVSEHTIRNIPTAFVALVTLFVATHLLLRRTRLGLHLYAVGQRAGIARLSGIHVTPVLYAAYIGAGLAAALAGLYLTSRVGAGLPNSGAGLELDSIAVVVLGGASLAGGRGTVLGTAAGVGIVTVLSNSMNLLGMDAFYQDIVKGVVIAVVAAGWVVLERFRRHRALA